MTSRASAIVASIILTSLLLSCSTTENLVTPVYDEPTEVNTESPLKDSAEPTFSYKITEPVKSDIPLKQIHRGSGNFINTGTSAEVDEDDAGEVTLNFQNAPIAELVKTILGDILNVNYTIDEGVAGSVSMRTTRPIAKDALISVLDSLLRTNGAAIIKSHDFYEVIPMNDDVPAALTPTTHLSADRGYQILIVPLRYISAKAMVKILEPIKSGKSMVQADEYRNLLMLAGTQGELFDLRETISIFDVDQLQGMSVGIFRLQNVEAKTMLEELQAIFGDSAEGPLAGLVRFTIIERLNALMVITPQEKYLTDVEKWITRLDQAESPHGINMYVYYVQNGKAENIAELLNQLFEGKRRQVMENNVEEAVVTSIEGDEDSEGRENEQISSIGTGDISIIAYPETNSLLILATPSDYNQVEKAVAKLDVIPMQVLIEASIIEVTLGDELEYGLQWFFTGDVGRYNTVGGLNIPASGRPPVGDDENNFVSPLEDPVNFTLALFDADKTRIVLNAIAGDSRLDVLSAPSLMVLDNHTAVIRVGDQVPIRTSETSNTSSAVDVDGVIGTNITSEIEYRDTGVTLEVTPRVNAGGMVMLDITQRVDDVSETTSSNIDSPTILQREIKTSVAVQSRETIVLGGLIREGKEESESGIPILKDIPWLGNLFKSTRTANAKTELVVLITPSAVANESDARKVTDEYKAKLKGVDFSSFK